jgi:hypothetical protein
VLVTLVAMATHSVPAAAGMNYATSDGRSGLFSYGGAGGGHDIQLSGEFAGVNNGDTLVEFFWCAATSTPDATVTALQGCSLSGATAVSAWTYPGGLAVAVGSARFSLSSLPAGGLALCGAAAADFAESLIGGSLSASACTPAPTAVPALPDPGALVADLSMVVRGEQDAVTALKNCLTFKTCSPG